MLVNGSRKHSNEFSLKLNARVLSIDNANSQKVLGIIIDDKLNWQGQVEQISLKLSRAIALLRKISNYLPLEAGKIYYNHYILPIIDYAAIIWGNGLTKDQINRITKFQKRALRIILNKSTFTPSIELFRESDILPFELRIHYHTCTMIHKKLHNMTPDYLRSNLDMCTDTYNYNLRSTTNNNLILPRPNSEKFKKSFKYCGAKLWNALPDELKTCRKLETFKLLLKKYLLSKLSNIM